MGNVLRGKQVPEFLRKRGIRWIMSKGVRLNFEHEHKLREQGFCAGFTAAKSGKNLNEALIAYKEPAFEAHCRRLGFTSSELNSLD